MNKCKPNLISTALVLAGFLTSSLTSQAGEETAISAPPQRPDIVMGRSKPMARYQIEINRPEATLVLSTTSKWNCEIQSENSPRPFFRGELRAAAVPEGKYTSIQTLVADYDVMAPYLACYGPVIDVPVVARIPLKHLPNMKFIRLDLIVPTEFKMHIE